MSAENRSDVPFTTRLTNETREKLERLADETGLNKKEFIEKMIQQYELYAVSEKTPLISADLKELSIITKRITDIYINIGDRITTIQNETEQKYKNENEQLQQKTNQLVERVQELTTLTDEQLIQIKQLKSQMFEDTRIMNELKDDKDRNIALIKEYEKKIKELEAKTSPDLKTKIDKLESQIKQLELQKDIEIMQLKEDYIKKLEENQKQYNTILTENQKQYNSIIEKFQTQKAEEAPNPTAKTTTKKRRSTKSKEAEQTIKDTQTTEVEQKPTPIISDPDSTN